MNRRQFFAFLPIAPAALMIEGAQASTKCDQPRSDEITLSLSGTKAKKAQNSTSIFAQYAESDPNKRISMAVGEDGNLWLKTAKGEWKKVVTE